MSELHSILRKLYGCEGIHHLRLSSQIVPSMDFEILVEIMQALSFRSLFKSQNWEALLQAKNLL